MLCVFFVNERTIFKWKLNNEIFFGISMLVMIVASTMVLRSDVMKKHLNNETSLNYEVYRIIILMIWIRSLQLILFVTANALFYLISRSNDDL